MKVIVVGGGIVGMSAAYHLSREEGVDVTLIDQKHEGQATAAGAGIVCPWISERKDNKAWYELARGGAHYYETLVEQLKEDGEDQWGFKRVGALAVSEDETELDDIEKSARDATRTSPEAGEITRLTNEAAKDLFPPLSDYFGAVHLSGAARIDGRQLRGALKRAAINHQAGIYQGEARLVKEGGQVNGVYIEGTFHPADHVIVAAGAWAPELLSSIGVTLPIEPQRGQIVHLQMPETDTSEWPMILPRTSYYMLAFDDSRIVAGASRENGTGFDYRQTAGGVQEVLESALSVAPGLAQSTLYETRVGFRPVVPDNLPLIGRVEAPKGLSIVNGLGPSGLTMGPYTGKLISDLTLGKDMGIDLSSYDPQRFDKGNSLFVTAEHNF
ncbi:FAD-dependent oxidoreductase [Salicibibacter halophilus]|uniref:FAD-dependent oxidoreductase n=1 Tax=Salicibibacter halophilus TaxID=2502791 RepID=A0A514LKL1_9BACI|nr:FAD-dependent oxidoreductase [Salicibibacter halophilus]QDI92410.1 FAD-dependent oxidoreductase [Salicibibacter halophilus]